MPPPVARVACDVINAMAELEVICLHKLRFAGAGGSVLQAAGSG